MTNAWKSLGREIWLWARLVKFSHTAFAMPFALAILVIIAKFQSVSLLQITWIIVALVSARTAAMAFNRLVDRHIDSLNPRTRDRELPAGVVSTGSVIMLIAASGLIFFASAGMLGQHCLVLAPVVLGFLFFYSLTKRFSAYSHLVLGIALSLAPGGVWYALTATVAVLPALLMAAVAVWVFGFDILYACQDVEFDRASGLYSLPAKLGTAHALRLSSLLHFLAVMLLILFGSSAGLGAVYFVGLFVFSLLLASQHRMVSPVDLSKVDAAFFTRNGIASVIFFFSVLADFLVTLS